MDVWLGKTFGKYRVKKFIGKGTIGSVYKAEQIGTNKIFAIKIFDLRLSHALKQKLDLLDEAKALQHENIVKIYERGEEHSTFYLIMEYIEGRNLLSVIEEKKRLDHFLALDIAKGVAKALVYSHKQGIIHRDIKPGNIIVTEDLKVKITDFGMAQIVNSVSDISQLDKIISTVFYISPEQAMGVKKIDYRTDFYSLGITLYQSLTGKIPYPGRTPLQVLQQHISSPLPRMTKAFPDIPNELEKIITKLTAKKRDERYSSAEKVLEKIIECRARLKTKKEFFPALPTWIISALVFAVLFFVGLTLANKLHKKSTTLPKEIKQKKALFSIKNISLVSSLGQKNNIFSKNSIICVEINWEIKQLPEKHLHKIFTIVFKGRNLNPITQNLGIAQLGNQYHKYCVSLRDFKYGKHVVRVGFIIDDTSGEKEMIFEIPRPTPEIHSIEIDPKKVILRPSSHQKFDYTVRDASGDILNDIQNIHWKASGGKIENGIYISGKKEGSFEVTVWHPGRKIKATAVIVIEKSKGDLGWFGEPMPKGLIKSETKGEYVWEKNRSMMVFVPSGKFWYGGQSKKTVYRKAFYIDKYEVSRREYQNFCTKTNRQFVQQPKWSSPDHPVVNISWKEARDYAHWLGKAIPSEVEWEKAAKGGLQIPDWRTDKQTVPLMLNPRPQRVYPWGDQFPNENGIYRCNYVSNDNWEEKHLDGYKRGAPVFAFSRWKSPYGCVNLAGNVWEWCFESFVEQKTKKVDKTKRILRGGSWYNHAKGCRTTRSHHGLVDERSEFIGIRLKISNEH